MKLQTLSLVMVALFLTACGKQSSNSSGSTRINRYSGNIAGQGTSTCNSNSWGRIYNNSSNETDFRQTVANFTLYNLEEIGMISPYYNSNTGIEFQMTLAFQNGQLVNGSKAGFKVTDSFVGQASTDGSAVLPIQFLLQNAVGGQAGNGQFDAKVGDTKGYVRFVGYRTTSQGQQVLVGEAFYNNYNQGESFLGNFVIQGCAATGI